MEALTLDRQDSKHPVWLLVQFGANVNARVLGGLTILHIATELEHLHESIRSIRVAGANPNVTAGKYAHTPLHQAVYHGSIDAVYALLDGSSASLGPPARIDATDNRGTTAIHWLAGFIVGAAEHPDAIKVLRVLLNAGADINKRTPDGMTALGIARANGYTDIVEQLEDSGGIL